jgi:hypothetical protein
MHPATGIGNGIQRLTSDLADLKRTGSLIPWAFKQGGGDVLVHLQVHLGCFGDRFCVVGC